MCEPSTTQQKKIKMDKRDVSRFGRQMMLPEVGMSGQLKLTKSSVLVIGAGGLGCPVCLYLCAGGVGRIGVVDGDEIEGSNIHRQVLYTEAQEGLSKAQTTCAQMRKINSRIISDAYPFRLTNENALDIISKYDVIVDCTDNVPTRYLISDCCAVTRKPLVCGSAIALEGQVTAYCFSSTSPCLRCVFPSPPNPTAVGSCSERGVLGVVTGMIGTLQAQQVMAIIMNTGRVLDRRMMIFDFISTGFKEIGLPPRSSKCWCSSTDCHVAFVKAFDYEALGVCSLVTLFPSLTFPLLPGDRSFHRISPSEFHTLQSNTAPNQSPFYLLDVRPTNQFNVSALPGSINVPFPAFEKDTVGTTKAVAADAHAVGGRVVVVCRRGNNSQVIAALLAQAGIPNVCDVIGGLTAYSDEVNPEFAVV
jgi:adenylyltransferase/sulfurtransferase